MSDSDHPTLVATSPSSPSVALSAASAHQLDGSTLQIIGDHENSPEDPASVSSPDTPEDDPNTNIIQSSTHDHDDTSTLPSSVSLLALSADHLDGSMSQLSSADDDIATTDNSNTKQVIAFKYTNGELSAIPAFIFPKFRSLPLEVQIRIWWFFSPDVLLEVVYGSRTKQYIPTIVRNSTLPTTPSYATAKFLQAFPIYIRNIWSPQGLPIFGNDAPIWIRPSDILYLQTLTVADIDAFIQRPENQKIENIAIEAIFAAELGCGHDSPHRDVNVAGQLIRGLKNLKNLYIMDGQTVTDELLFSGHRDPDPTRSAWLTTWSKVPTGDSRFQISQYGASRGGPILRWDTGLGEQIKERMEREVAWGVNNGGNGDFVPPNLIFRQINRRYMNGE